MFKRHVGPQVVYLGPGIHKDLEQAADDWPLLRPRQVIIPFQAACKGVWISFIKFSAPLGG